MTKQAVDTNHTNGKNLSGRKMAFFVVVFSVLGTFGLWQTPPNTPVVPVSIVLAQEAGVERHLAELPEFFTLNKDGKKYETVKFSHAAHASKKYTEGIQCQTCHHTQEGDGKPEKCSECHAIGGDAEEEKLKTRASHTKGKPFPKEAGQEEVSCISCHRSQNALLEAGQRSGEEAPTKCKSCHEKKS